MAHDPVDIAELQHDIRESRMLRLQIMHEQQFKDDPDWEAVANKLLSTGRAADICYLVSRLGEPSPEFRETTIDTVRRMVHNTIRDCATEYGVAQATREMP
jgi:hypothetical protein